jgi:multidrug resistance efflux pump
MLQRIFSKDTVLVMVIVILLVGGAMPVQAFDNCQKKIHKAEMNLEKAIRQHGLHSSQAERKRDQLERARARCKP